MRATAGRTTRTRSSRANVYAVDDSDGDGVPDCVDKCPGVDDAVFAPECMDRIPTVSEWGLVIWALLLLAGG